MLTRGLHHEVTSYGSVDSATTSSLRLGEGCFRLHSGLDLRAIDAPVTTDTQVKGEANPLYLLAAITLGIPALLLIPLVGLNPGVQDGTFTTVMTFLFASAFVTAVVFEIKRLVDQPSDEGQH